MAQWFDKQKSDFILNFVKDDRYKFIVDGLWVTLKVTFFAVLIGIFLGIIVAIVRASYEKNKDRKPHNKVTRFFLEFSNTICKIYLTAIRGTPVLVQLLIMFFIIFASSRNKVLIAILTFGINSGAYVAEIVRSGIMSIDNGQFEAGRSLGFGYIRTMYHIILPQAFKNVLPALANEFIVLLKETSVCGYVGLIDLTKGGDIIRGNTFSAFMPLICVAVIYLVMVMIFSSLVTRLERRLRNSDH